MTIFLRKIPPLTAVLCALATAQAQAQDPIIEFSASDLAMNAAIADAQQTLPLFLAHVLDESGTLTRDDALLKVGLPTEPGSPITLEHIWITPFARLSDDAFAGILANEPWYLGDDKQGDKVEFTLSQISDWSLNSPDNRYYGGYTLRVMHGEGAFGETPFDQVFETNPIPPDWR